MDPGTLHLLCNLHHVVGGTIDLDSMVRKVLKEENQKHRPDRKLIRVKQPFDLSTKTFTGYKLPTRRESVHQEPSSSKRFMDKGVLSYNEHEDQPSRPGIDRTNSRDIELQGSRCVDGYNYQHPTLDGKRFDFQRTGGHGEHFNIPHRNNESSFSMETTGFEFPAKVKAENMKSRHPNELGIYDQHIDQMRIADTGYQGHQETYTAMANTDESGYRDDHVTMKKPENVSVIRNVHLAMANNDIGRYRDAQMTRVGNCIRNAQETMGTSNIRHYRDTQVALATNDISRNAAAQQTQPTDYASNNRSAQIAMAPDYLNGKREEQWNMAINSINDNMGAQMDMTYSGNERGCAQMDMSVDSVKDYMGAQAIATGDTCVHKKFQLTKANNSSRFQGEVVQMKEVASDESVPKGSVLAKTSPDASTHKETRVIMATSEQHSEIGYTNAQSDDEELEAIVKKLVRGQQCCFVDERPDRLFSSLPVDQSMSDQYDETTSNMSTIKKAIMNTIGMRIQQIVKFSKGIPDFSTLNISDRLNLIKCNHEFDILVVVNPYSDGTDFMLMQTASKSEAATIGTKDFDLRSKRIHVKDHLNIGFNEIGNVMPKVYMEELLKIVSELIILSLTERETAVLRAMCILFPDRCELEDESKVRQIYAKLTSCLIHVVKGSECPDVGERLNKIHHVLGSLRTFSDLYGTLLEQVFGEWSEFNHFELVKEFMSF